MSHPHEHCDDLLGAYVLGACSPAEAADVAAHLERCARCAGTTRGLRDGADMLLHVPPEQPPAGFKDRVMAPVRAEASLFEAARAGAYEPTTREGAAAPASWRPSLRPRPLARPPVAAFAAALVLLVVGGGLLARGLGAAGSQTTVVVAQAEAGQPRDASARLELRGDRAQLRVRGLRDPGRGRVYQVWVRRDRQVPEPAGAMLRVDARGSAQAQLPGGVRRFDQVLVTSEPAAGSVLPTSVPVLEIDTSA